MIAVACESRIGVMRGRASAGTVQCGSRARAGASLAPPARRLFCAPGYPCAMARWLALALLLALGAAPAQAASARTLALAEVRAPTGGLVVRAGVGPFIYPARGRLAMLVGSSRIVRRAGSREAVLTRVS